jgi:hypothetical protein
MADMTAAIRGLRWQYANDRIGLAALERKVEDALRLEAREPAPVSELVAVHRGRKTSRQPQNAPGTPGSQGFSS